MKAAKLFRNQLGLSQEVMAQYLNVSRSQLAMYEAGKRDLPTDALVKLSAITLFLDGLTENKKEETLFLNEQEIEFNTVLTRHTKELEYKLIKEQRVLEAIVKKQNQNLNLYKLALHLQKRKTLQSEILFEYATSVVKENTLSLRINQIVKLKGIKSQLNYINFLKKSK